jgi:hypothetical protein
MPSIIKVDQIQSDQGFVNVSSNLQFSSGFTMLSPTLSSPTLTTPTTSGVMTLGAGIKFPATQSASADANTLDDYEEGTWTGTIKGLTTDPTIPVTATGSYTKIGRFVFAKITYSNITTTGASGDFYVTGLPFTAGDNFATGNVMTYSLATFAGANNLSPYISGTSVFLYHMSSNGIWAAATHNAGTARYLELSVTYQV